MGKYNLAKAIEEAIQANRQKPPRERFNALVARGAIDAKGKVLISTPGPVKAVAKAKAKKGV